MESKFYFNCSSGDKRAINEEALLKEDEFSKRRFSLPRSFPTASPSNRNERVNQYQFTSKFNRAVYGVLGYSSDYSNNCAIQDPSHEIQLIFLGK